MTVMQYKSIAVFWLLQAHYSHSFATPSLPSVLKQKSSSANVGKLYSAFLPDGFFDSGCIPMVSTVPEQYDCIFSAESTTISDSSAYLGSLSAKVDPTRLQMPLSLEARVQEDFVSFRSSSLPYFDRTHLADELRGKITASKEAIVDSIHDKVLHDFPEVPFRKEVEDFMTTSHGYRIVMGGSKPGISMVAGQSGFFTDMPISAALLQQEDISEVANEIAKTAATPVHSDISQMLTDKTDISSVSSESVSMKSMIEGLVSSAQDQSALQQIPSTAAFDHQLAQTGSIFSDITSNLFKISENMMSKNVEASASSTGAGADWMEKGNMAVQTVGAAFENKRNDIFDTSGKSIQVVADQPVHEIGKSGAQLLSKLAGGTVDSLESISHHLSQFLESLGSSLPSDLVEGTQAAIHKVKNLIFSYSISGML